MKQNKDEKIHYIMVTGHPAYLHCVLKLLEAFRDELIEDALDIIQAEKEEAAMKIIQDDPLHRDRFHWFDMN